ncbi:MAG: hypothetical protein IPM33_08855 [Phycisphaerales bacterium]|nr:hypothetical protein [Phycisphaerales bacterium]
MSESHRLSQKSISVLGLIAEGHSYAQIVDGHPDISYLDIFQAAEEALHHIEPKLAYQQWLADLRQRYPNAYQAWTPTDDAELESSFRQGSSTRELARRFGRQPSAIRSRLVKLGLLDGRAPQH